MRYSLLRVFIRSLYTLTPGFKRIAPNPINAVSARPIRSITLPFWSALFHTAESRKMSYPVKKSDAEWQAQLSSEQFRVLRQQGTEAPYTGEYDKHFPEKGVYTCAACQAPLYTANQKFKSGCGWPAFFDTVPGAVTRHTDSSFGMERTEIVCSNCGSHLGHVFKGEGYPTPTDERHCVNSVSLKFSDDSER
ncbi:methionine-R-sulfoxide reductase [Piedraia hortae CBS 480.64]|uniref:Peptide-methionine (R)-S-oxide reductase n=1 Tax=Piedraia hortae CBS 480.64 TaxID=1314780 RepID=A0A6A7BZW3_9PEZI|nr:methionine-R-sulfoxide reductase [Piedraia hortae CBS 480.64]